MNRKQEVTLTNMCLIYKNEEILVLDKIVDGKSTGITFPGGHVEKDESFFDSVVREVFEETGLKISHPKLCGIKNWVEDDGHRYIVFLYKTNIFSGKIKSSDEGEVFWISKNDFHNAKLAYNTDRALKLMEDDELSEFFYYKVNNEWKHKLL